MTVLVENFVLEIDGKRVIYRTTKIAPPKRNGFVFGNEQRKYNMDASIFDELRDDAMRNMFDDTPMSRKDINDIIRDL